MARLVGQRIEEWHPEYRVPVVPLNLEGFAYLLLLHQFWIFVQMKIPFTHFEIHTILDWVLTWKAWIKIQDFLSRGPTKTFFFLYEKDRKDLGEEEKLTCDEKTLSRD